MNSTTLGDLTAGHVRRLDGDAYFKHQVAKAIAGSAAGAMLILEHRLDRAHRAQLEEKAAVAATSTFSDPSLAEPRSWAAAYLSQVAALSAIDRIGARGVPLNILIPTQTAGSTFDWVGEGLPLPVSKMALDVDALPPRRIGGIRTYSKALVLSADPHIQALVQSDGHRCLAIASDRCAWDPTRTAVSNISPASLTSGAIEITTSGSSGEALETDARDSMMAISDGNPERPIFVTNKRVAVYLASKRTTAGLKTFPDLGIDGGAMLGAPVVIGAGVGDLLVAVDAAGVLLGDGGITIDMSRQAALQMDSSPSR